MHEQVHDFWHVLCGLPPTVLGELALKWVEMVQTGLPVAAFSGLFGPLALGAGACACWFGMWIFVIVI
jgi:ubiquinone biosynthesis protein COQ4